MNTSLLISPPVSLHATARQYCGRAFAQRLIECTTLPQLIAGFELSSLTMPALTWYEAERQSLHFSFDELVHQIRTLACWLVQERCVQRGDRVVVISSNCPEVYVAHLALMSLGAVTVPVSNTESVRVLQLIVDRVDPLFMLTGRDVTQELTAAGSIPSHLLPMLPLVPKAGEGQFSWPAQEVLADDPAVILFTSGTTSAPKGVCLSHYNLLVNAHGLKQTHNLVQHRVHMCILPLFHANAFGFSMIASLYAGNHVVLSAGLPGDAIWQILREQRVDIISLVPEIIRVLSTISVDRDSLPDLKYVVSAAAPLPKTVAHEFITSTGIAIHQGYGLSECVNFAATVPWDISESNLECAMDQWAVPSIGTAVFGCEINILRADGSSAAAQEEGEIAVSGHTLMLGYWGDFESTQAVLGDGNLRTGDLGFFDLIDGQRFFFVTGRKKEIIIRYGENLSPLAIEAELEALRSIGRYAVIGFANEMAGEEIGLYVLSSRTLENERKALEIVRLCSSRYRPRVIMFGSEPIPSTPTGKVKRSLLAQRFKNYAGRTFGSDPILITINT